MSGKTVVFCEGIREATLISIILEQKSINNKIIPHEDLDRSQSRENAPENNRINDFLGRKGQGLKFLLKDEGGDKKCVNGFLELYKDKDDTYSGIVLIDSPVFNYFKDTAIKELKRDILKQESENLFLTKDSKSPRIVHRVFFTPISLEHQVYEITGKNLDLQNRDEMKVTLKQFVTECRTRRVAWFLELESIVLFEP